MSAGTGVADKDGNKGTNHAHHPRRVRARELDLQVLELRKAGGTFEQIGRQLGKSHGAVHKAFLRAMAAHREELQQSVAEARAIEVARLDHMLLKLWPAVNKGDQNAIHRALKVCERRSRLLGLDLQPEPFGFNPNPGAGVPTQIAVVFVNAGDNKLLSPPIDVPPAPRANGNGHAMPSVEFVPANGKDHDED